MKSSFLPLRNAMVSINNAAAAIDDCFTSCIFFQLRHKKKVATEFTEHAINVCNTLVNVLFTKETLSQKHNHLEDS